MTSEQQDLAGRCLLASLEYLKRNGFTKLRQVNGHIILAKDGSREVYVWIEYSGGDKVPMVLGLPTLLFQLADHDGARVDVISMCATGEMKHVLNVKAE